MAVGAHNSSLEFLSDINPQASALADMWDEIYMQAANRCQ